MTGLPSPSSHFSRALEKDNAQQLAALRMILGGQLLAAQLSPPFLRTHMPIPAAEALCNGQVWLTGLLKHFWVTL